MLRSAPFRAAIRPAVPPVTSSSSVASTVIAPPAPVTTSAKAVSVVPPRTFTRAPRSTMSLELLLLPTRTHWPPCPPWIETRSAAVMVIGPDFELTSTVVPF